MELVDDKRLFATYGIVFLVATSFWYLVGTKFILSWQWESLLRAIFSGIGTSLILVLLIKNYLWRLKMVRVLLDIRVPRIQGRWKGHIKSSYTKHSFEHPVVLEIRQTMDSIFIWYYDETAFSYTIAARFVELVDSGPHRLYSIYHNVPLKTDDRKRLAHNGVMELLVHPDERQINGIYYNNAHQRGTYGELHVVLCARELVGGYLD